MTIEQFWNKAFIAALGRLSVEEAKAEADKATTVCIQHWQANIYNMGPEIQMRWQAQDVAAVPRLWPSGDPRNDFAVKLPTV